MKTLELPDDLYRKVEEIANMRAETVTAVVTEALDSAVASWEYASTEKSQSDDQPESTADREARMKRWREEEAAFLEQMRGPDLDPRSAAEIVSEGRRG